MELTREQKSIIIRVVNVFETGSVEGVYACISIYNDGPHDIPQISYGKNQATEYGSLRTLVQRYVDAEGKYSDQLSRFADLVGSVPLSGSRRFKKLLRDAGRKDPAMKEIQDLLFEQKYFLPAMEWAGEQGFAMPISALVIYDSFVHSGSVLWLIRQRFPENPPSLGGEETAWVTAYVRERHAWMQSHRRAAVRACCYRTGDLKREIARENWDLSELPISANGVEVYPGG